MVLWLLVAWLALARAEVRVEVASGAHYVGLGSGVYPDGATVRVQAAPEVGYRFVRWTGDVPDGLDEQNPLEFQPAGEVRLEAEVAPAEDPWAGWAETRIWRVSPADNSAVAVYSGVRRARRLGFGAFGRLVIRWFGGPSVRIATRSGSVFCVGRPRYGPGGGTVSSLPDFGRWPSVRYTRSHTTTHPARRVGASASDSDPRPGGRRFVCPEQRTTCLHGKQFPAALGGA